MSDHSSRDAPPTLPIPDGASGENPPEGYRSGWHVQWIVSFRDGRSDEVVEKSHFQVEGHAIVFGDSLYQGVLRDRVIYPLDRIDHVREIRTRVFTPIPEGAKRGRYS